jgi:hypothetical protein
MPKQLDFGKSIQGLLIGVNDDDIRSGPRAPQHEMRIERLEIENLEKLDVAQQAGGGHAQNRDERANRNVPPPLVHANLACYYDGSGDA